MSMDYYRFRNFFLKGRTWWIRLPFDRTLIVEKIHYRWRLFCHTQRTTRQRDAERYFRGEISRAELLAKWGHR